MTAISYTLLTTGLLTAGLMVTSMATRAVDLRPIDVRTGTDGLVRAVLSVSNVGTDPLSCTAQLAHWYSSELAIVGPGETARIDLWIDPDTGTVALLNDRQENMPVEALWCGIEGRAYETRAALTLDGGRTAEAAARAVRCDGASGRVVCE